MNQKVLVFEPKKCIGCRLCEQICTLTHFKVTNPKKSRIRIIRDTKKNALDAENALKIVHLLILLCTLLENMF